VCDFMLNILNNFSYYFVIWQIFNCKKFKIELIFNVKRTNIFVPLYYNHKAVFFLVTLYSLYF
ncbi:hypothetical protein PPACK8108_LOCUS17858, partial [Phakopsora pachyrhizi]